MVTMSSDNKRDVEVVSLVESSSEELEVNDDYVSFKVATRKRRQPARAPATKRARRVVLDEASSEEASSQREEPLSQSSPSTGEKKGKKGARTSSALTNMGPLTFISGQAVSATKPTQNLGDEKGTPPKPPLPTACKDSVVNTKKRTHQTAGPAITKFTVKGHNMAEAAAAKASKHAQPTQTNGDRNRQGVTGLGSLGHLLTSSQPGLTTASTTRTGPRQQDVPAAGVAECWVHRHTPTRSEDLVVHKKKVSELQTWMSAWATGTATGQRLPKLMILTGPAGCGKSSTVNALASELGMQVVEWSAPAPTLWQETLYHKQSYNPGEGSAYASKMDDFAAFVSRAKYPALPMSGQSGVAGSPNNLQLSQGLSTDGPGSQQAAAVAAAGNSRTGANKLLLCDDLPHVHDAQRRQHLATLLVDLATTTRCPVVLIVTETSGNGLSGAGGGAGGGRPGQNAALTDSGLHKDLQGMLQDAGAGVIAFNKLTDASISKALLRIAQAESCPLSKEAADSLASSADGDIRNAVQSLELMLGRTSTSSHNIKGNSNIGKSSSQSKKGTRAAAGKAGKARGSKSGAGAGGAGKTLLPQEAAALPALQRDLGLVLFHALGKLLHNKRDGGVGNGADLVDKQVSFDDEDLMISTVPDTKTGTSKRPGLFQTRRTQVGKSLKASETGSSAKHKHDSSSIQIDLTDSQDEHDMTGTRQQATLNDSEDHGHGTSQPMLLRSIPSFAYTEDLLQPSQRRPPMRYDPESIVSKAGLEAPTLIAFLHANYTRFISSYDMDQACAAAEYLSHATLLSRGPLGGTAAGSGTSMWSEEDGAAANLAAAAATSVAARGLLYAHQPHGSAGYVPLHSSNHHAAERAAAANMSSLKDVASRMALHRSNGAGPGSGLLLACQVLPFLRVLNTDPSYTWLNKVMPGCWSHFFNGQVSEQRSWQPHRGGADISDLAMALQDTALESQQEAGSVPDDPIEED